MNIYMDQEEEVEIVYVNGKTRQLFKTMLNELKNPLDVGNEKIPYGVSLFNLNRTLFETMFNQWVTKCQDLGYMVIQNDNASERYLKWNEDLDHVERAIKGMSVLKEML